MDSTKILVVGYPKSGNTWLTRLVAEMIGCPVAGFFDQPTMDEMAMEGASRVSKHSVFKGHQTSADIAGKIPVNRIIYVVRDVRQVVVSGSHYFRFRPKSLGTQILYRVLGRPYERLFLRTPSRRIAGMIDAVKYGNSDLAWCNVPWDEHVQGYLETGCKVVRYEDMLENPIATSCRIMEYLGLDWDAQTIASALEKQSFSVVKQKFHDQGDSWRSKFLREARTDSWRDVLSTLQAEDLSKHFDEILERLGYATR